MSTTPHDALFKAAFSQVEQAADELRHLLPPALLARLDLSSLSLEAGSFVDDLATQSEAALHARAASAYTRLVLSALQQTRSERDLAKLLRDWDLRSLSRAGSGDETKKGPRERGPASFHPSGAAAPDGPVSASCGL